MIRFIQLDDTNREFSLTDGVYNQEYDSNKMWIWTNQHFGGTVSNISYITLTVESNIQNTLYYDDISVKLIPDCVNIVKIKTQDKKTFEIKLSDPYLVSNDDRVLGVKITRIVLDQDVVF
jgi:hypothetical protein